MKKIIYCMVFHSLVWMGCDSAQKGGHEVGITSLVECKVMPKYIRQAGFMPGKPFGFSVAEKGVVGLSLVQFPSAGVPYKRFALPSWSNAGHLGAVVTDQQGNNYVAPRPFINTLRNKPELQNIVYRVDGVSGQMDAFVKLPVLNENVSGQPFGLMGLVYDCESEILYASSVFGSDVNRERGSIYAIQTIGEAVVKGVLSDVDAVGLGIAYFEGRKNLFYGKARNSDIFRIELDKKGGFIGQPIFVHSIAQLGDRGDDKPRKIKFDRAGNMIVSGVEFNFNLSNSADLNENIYTFQWLTDQKEWILINHRKGIQ
jgi:hypothetical protein